MINLIIALVIGFIAGALVFRNNAKKAEAIVTKTDAQLKAAGLAIKNFKK